MQTINTNSCNLARHQARIRHVFTEERIDAEYTLHVTHRRHDRRLLIASIDEGVHERHHFFGHLKEFPHACRKPLQPTQPGQELLCSVPRNLLRFNTRCIAFSKEDRVTMSHKYEPRDAETINHQPEKQPQTRCPKRQLWIGLTDLSSYLAAHAKMTILYKENIEGERQAKLDPPVLNPATTALPPLSAWFLGPTTCGSSTIPTQIRFSQHIL